MEESRVTAEESEGRDGEAEGLLPVCYGLGGDEAEGGTTNGVLEKRGGLEVGVDVDGVVYGFVLNPFQPHLHY